MADPKTGKTVRVTLSEAMTRVRRLAEPDEDPMSRYAPRECFDDEPNRQARLLHATLASLGWTLRAVREEVARREIKLGEHLSHVLCARRCDCCGCEEDHGHPLVERLGNPADPTVFTLCVGGCKREGR